MYRINGITCCVGARYSQLLSKSLPLWLDTLDTLTIVTRRGDRYVESLCETFGDACNLQLVETDVLTQHGAYFNKAAALCVAYAAAQHEDWVLHFDSDIIPPVDWNRRIHLHQGILYGAFRYDELGNCLDESPLYPYGYFHLWHAEDPHAWRWPIFQVNHPHAGNYDSNFADQWPMSMRRNLGFNLIHQGVPRQSWFGEANDHLMASVHATGLFETRKLAARGVGTLNLPEPMRRVFLENAEGMPSRTVQILNQCAKAGPFALQATVDRNEFRDKAHVVIPPSLELDDVKELLNVRYR